MRKDISLLKEQNKKQQILIDTLQQKLMDQTMDWLITEYLILKLQQFMDVPVYLNAELQLQEENLACCINMIGVKPKTNAETLASLDSITGINVNICRAKFRRVRLLHWAINNNTFAIPCYQIAQVSQLHQHNLTTS